MDITITIPLPVLVGSQIFRVRYRVVGSPTWTLVTPDQTNAPFTLTGLLPETTYELEFTLIDGEVECDSVIRTFYVPGDIPCIEAEVTFEIIPGSGREDDIYRLVIDYNYPSPFVPACYYEIIYGISGGAQTTLTYQTLPPSPIKILASNNTYSVTIRAFDCEGNWVDCFEEDVTPEPPECTGGELLDADIITLPTTPQTYGIQLVVTQSTPPTSSYIIQYNQLPPVLTGIPDPGGTIGYTGTPTTTTIVFPVNPNFNVPFVNGSKTISYVGSIVDECGLSIKWQASLDLS